MATKKRKRKCKVPESETKSGKPCGAHPLKPGTVIDGITVTGDYCRGHDPALPTKTQLSDEDRRRGGEGRRLPRPHEILRQKIEDDVESWLAPLIEARGKGKPIKTWDGKQHKIIYVGDPELGMKATKLAFSLVFGKPKQPLELTGEDGGPIELESDLADPKVKEALFDAARAIDARRRSG